MENIKGVGCSYTNDRSTANSSAKGHSKNNSRRLEPVNTVPTIGLTNNICVEDQVLSKPLSNIPNPLKFGKTTIPVEHVFLNSSHSVAIVNLKPITPNHVLIISKRNVDRLSKLTIAEQIDLFRTMKTVKSKLEEVNHPDAFNISMQDGKAAGQSVPHLHLHLLPRKEGDFKRNDDVYELLEQQDLS